MVRNALDAAGSQAVTHASMCREVGGTICDRASTLKASGLLSEQKIAIVMAFADELRRSLKCDTELRSEPPTMQPLPVQALPKQLPAGRDGVSTLHGLSGNPLRKPAGTVARVDCRSPSTGSAAVAKKARAA